ncbi:response regulator [Sphingobacterium sp. DK4209]|uniref:Response regulator n=1 Tax=Sphingobacterium zhuxiongii TaxID=2662364 RepID=A0A5Q0QBF8_9SPHI|nr:MULTISPECIES: response regulator transcription factor [unclassified Sphingobacterium]MVZ66078.1 response regulator [Sphingobacterium sp. DK4209]QGA26499.1 response regulator [Sphingobacterium sp. dk4302]
MDTGKDNKNNVCVAVIDDNAQLRDISVNQLENSGYTVLFQTGVGQEALQKLKEHDGWPDVCIIEEDFATAKLLLEKHPDLKILISSTQDDTESITDMLKAGVSGYILKFADPNEMLTAVKVLSENKKYFSVGISGTATEYFKSQPQS